MSDEPDPQVDTVELTLPRRASMGRVARLAASGLASTSSFDVAAIDDIKIVVSEVMLLIVENGAGDTVGLTMTVDDKQFVVSGHTPVADVFNPKHPDVELSNSVLEGIGAPTLITVVDGVLRIDARFG